MSAVSCIILSDFIATGTKLTPGIIPFTVGMVGLTAVGINWIIRANKKLKQLKKQKMVSQVGFNINPAKKHYAISFKLSF